jgi:hypothetical protein
MSYCEVITPMKYETKNDGAGKPLHQKILLKERVKRVSLTYYEYKPAL